MEPTAGDHAQPMFSLFDTLTASPPGDYPVTELIKRLLLIVGHEVSSPSFHRNALLSYQFVSAAREIWHQIHRLIAQMDSPNDTSTDIWTIFVKYTSLIESTETALLNFQVIAEKESKAPREVDHLHGLSGYLDWISQWEGSRKAIKDALAGIAAHTQTNNSLDTSLGRQDDNAFLQTLTLADNSSSFPKNKKLRESPSQILSSFKRIQIPFENETALVWYTKLAMILNAIFKLANEKNADQSIVEFQRRLRNIPDIWNAAQDLVNTVNELAKGPSSDKASNVQSKWDRLIEALKKISPIPPPNYSEILRLVKDIRRPFYGQAVALVKLLNVLANYLKSSGNNANIEQSNSLQDAIDGLKSSLKIAKETMKSVIMSIELSPEERETIQAEFNKAEIVLTDCFRALNPPSESLEDWKRKIQEAKNADNERMGKFHLIKSKEFANPAGTSSSQEIKVTVSSSGDPQPQVLTYNVSGDMQMSGLLWKIARDHPPTSQTITNSVFTDAQSNQRIGMDNNIKSVASREVKLELS